MAIAPIYYKKYLSCKPLDDAHHQIQMYHK
jgi:hypothetical protein